MKRIIYPNDNGGIAVMIPAPDIVGMLMRRHSIPAFVASELPTGDYVETERLSLEEAMHLIAKKNVPTGLPYKIIDTADVPSDRTFRNAWEADFSTFDGVGGAE